MAGNSNSGRKDKHVRDALVMEMKLREADGDKKGMRKVASKVWDEAENGERWAVEFVRDTIDGKPNQQVDMEVGATGDFAEFLARIASQGRQLGNDSED